MTMQVGEVARIQVCLQPPRHKTSLTVCFVDQPNQSECVWFTDSSSILLLLQLKALYLQMEVTCSKKLCYDYGFSPFSAVHYLCFDNLFSLDIL